MSKYISHFPKPLLDDLVTGRWLPVLGAGLSLNAAVPPGKQVPLWNGLGKELAKELNNFDPTSVLDSISAYEHEFGRVRLIERLSELLLIAEAQPGSAHREFCSIPFDLVCTTNFDFLLERQYDLIPRYVYPVVDEDQLSINLKIAGTILLKLHGDLRHPKRLIVTESDYDSFLHTYPLLATYLANQLITKTAVFVGYSLDDPDFRQIWHVVSDRLGHGRRMAYAIAVNSSPSDSARFERRGVHVINLPGTRDRYGDVLAAAFGELREYIRSNVISVSKVTEEQPLRELLLPRDLKTRLCFFSVPLDLLPFYRETVFPIVEEAGFVPITADDVVTPGDNVTAKLDTLIDRAAVMVTELTSAWTRAEYRMALARINDLAAEMNDRPALRLIIVAQYDQQLPLGTSHSELVYRPDIFLENPESFLSQLRNLFQSIAEEMGVRTLDEPVRLLQAKEYRASVISAMTLLEEKLRDRLGKGPRPENRRVLPLRTLIDEAIQLEIIPSRFRKDIDLWVRVRNEAVHSSVQITKAMAHEIVTGVAKLLDILSSDQ